MVNTHYPADVAVNRSVEPTLLRAGENQEREKTAKHAALTDTSRIVSWRAVLLLDQHIHGGTVTLTHISSC